MPVSHWTHSAANRAVLRRAARQSRNGGKLTAAQWRLLRYLRSLDGTNRSRGFATWSGPAVGEGPRSEWW